MSLYFYTQPIEHFLFDDFEDDFFNYPLIRRHHFGYGNPRHNYHHHGHGKNLCNTLEKQLSKVLNDNEIFEIADFSPKINLSEDEKNYYIHADLPGMIKDQVKMELNEDRILTISGERESIYNNHKDSENDKMETENDNKTEEKQETSTETSKPKEEKNKNETNENNEITYNMIECSYGKFSRSFSIPEDANLENIQAKMENGVLEVVFQKMEPPKNQNHTIQIQ